MRGKPMPSRRGVRVRGITPADAGKTNPVFNVDSAYRDHPRGCGENLSPKPLRLTSTGSPPRMRGKPQVLQGIGEVIGITPADAGKTSGITGRPDGSEDHPRGCGENCRRAQLQKVPPGSPPRMRGKLVSSGQVSQAQRITPADAGKTSIASLPTLSK